MVGCFGGRSEPSSAFEWFRAHPGHHGCLSSNPLDPFSLALSFQTFYPTLLVRAYRVPKIPSTRGIQREFCCQEKVSTEETRTNTTHETLTFPDYGRNETPDARKKSIEHVEKNIFFHKIGGKTVGTSLTMPRGSIHGGYPHEKPSRGLRTPSFTRCRHPSGAVRVEQCGGPDRRAQPAAKNAGRGADSAGDRARAPRRSLRARAAGAGVCS